MLAKTNKHQIVLLQNISQDSDKIRYNQQRAFKMPFSGGIAGPIIVPLRRPKLGVLNTNIDTKTLVALQSGKSACGNMYANGTM